MQPELDRLIAADQKIPAIKHYRTVTGAGLKDAKEAVEARMEELAAQARSDSPPGLQPELDRYIAADQKIMAIKHYRTITNVGLKEAKDAVEARIAELGKR
jgi:ribosomal protein L7/L12